MTVVRDERGRFTSRQTAIEIRDPSAATNQISYMGRDAPQVPVWDAGQAIKLGYYSNVIAYRCVQILAMTAAGLPILCGPDPRSGRVNPVSRLAQLLGPPPLGPAPKLSARKLIAWTWAQYKVTGRWAWEIETPPNSSEVIALWPLAASSLQAVPSDGGTEWFRLFKYGRPDKPTKINPDHILYDWKPSADDYRQPESALLASRYDLSAAIMGDRYSLAFLKNGAIPAAVVINGQRPPTKEAEERYEQRWASEYQGPDNAGRTRFQYLEGLQTGEKPRDYIDVITLGLSQKDSQFMADHKNHLEMVAISLGVPWSKLDASGRTFDNAGHEDFSFWDSTMEPDLHDFEDFINLNLAPRVGTDLMCFDLSKVRALQRPKPFTVADGVAMANLGDSITHNELRAAAELPPVPGGDVLIPKAAAPVFAPPSDAAATADPIDSTTGDGTGRGEELTKTRVERRELVPVATFDPKGVETTPMEDPGPARRLKAWRSADAVSRSLEARWERGMKRLFARQAATTMGLLKGKRGHKALELRDSAVPVDPSAIFNRQKWLDDTREVAEDLFEAVTAQGFARVSDWAGIAFDLESPYVRDFILNRANKLAGQVTDTTYEQIRLALADGVSDGATIDQLGAAVQSVFDHATGARAATIARTEVVGAFNGSAQLAATQLPADVVAGQEWIATEDSRTREDHADADGQQVLIGEAFDVGGETLAYPGDPNGSADEIINCRCTVGFLTPDEMADTGRGRTVELRDAVVALALHHGDELALRRALREVA